MKKVKVLREMPGIQAGRVLNADFRIDMASHCGDVVESIFIEQLVEQGFLEYVKEEEQPLKSLVEKFREKWVVIPDSEGWEFKVKILAQIAKEHYLGVFDKARQEREKGYVMDDFGKLNHIRKAMEDCS